MAGTFSDDGPNQVKTTVVVFGDSPIPPKGTITLNVRDHNNQLVASAMVFGHSIDPKKPGHIQAMVTNGVAILQDCDARAYDVMIEGAGAGFYMQTVFRNQQNVTVNITLPKP